MKVTYNWLREYVDFDASPDELTELLTMVGLEVESVEKVSGGFDGIVVAEVLEKEQHPDADRLSLCKVNDGKEVRQIVCGATNFDIGSKVPLALPGCEMPVEPGEKPFKIKVGKIRGVESCGMMCSGKELGIADDASGLLILSENSKVGQPFAEHLGRTGDDVVYDLEVTPNRPDWNSVIGIARELSALTGNPLRMPQIPELPTNDEEASDVFDVLLDNTEQCPRYNARILRGVQVGPSPDWLRNKLEMVGVRSINNVVDVTNFVMLETGQPLHAFDLDKIKGNKVIVSTVENKTKFITLDDVERELSSNDLMISNTSSPMCIAGVFGGADSGVSESTTDVFLESAYFNPVSVRKTAKRHTLSTDASFRFERGCDPNITVYALKRAALLIQEICGGTISSEVVDIYPNPIPHFAMELTYPKMDSLIGEKIDREVVRAILTDLEIEIKNTTDNGLSLLVPPFRADVQREVDVIEEILRIYGFNTVAIPAKLNTTISHADGVNPEDVRNIISDLLSSTGFNEAMNNSLTKGKYTALIPELDMEQNVEILNPLSQDLNVMRQSLLFSGLENIAYNQNRRNADIKFYEFGKTYHKTEEGNEENQHLQILVSGRKVSENWETNAGIADFYFIKEKVEHILSRLGVKKIKSEAINTHGFSDGLMYKFKKKRMVCFGKLNTKLCKSFGVKSTVYAADFNWDLILELAGYAKIKYQEVSKFPSVRRDLSLLIDKSVSFAELKKIATATDNKILKSVNLFDVYEGDKLPNGKKSYALSFIMADETKTLTDKYVDKLMDKLMKSFTDKAGAEIR